MHLIQETLDSYYDAVYDTNRDLALHVIDTALEKGITPEEIVFEVVIPAIDRMIKDLTVNLDATISQHFIASKVAEEVTESMVLKFKKKPGGEGTIVIGTAWNDFHGLGKKIVSGCLRAHLYNVHDLGLNVPAEKFVDAAVAENAGIIGVSTMMLHTAKGENGAILVRKLLKERGLEDKIKLIVGGAPYRFDPDLYQEVGADSWAENGVAAVKGIEG
jgi:methanogenic corrinoid protein MtbC1